MERVYYSINEAEAKIANNMMSFYDYKEGSKTAEYKRYVDQAYELAEKVVEAKPEQADLVYSMADRYSKKMAEYINKDIHICCMCPSIMIVGAAKFPVQKKEKQNRARERNQEEYQKVQKYLDKIEALLYDEERILASDKAAISKLQEKLDNLVQKQERMKKVNAYYRKYKTLHSCPDLTLEEIKKLQIEMQDSWHCADKPYLSWQLTNNNQKIHQTKERLASLKAIKEKETLEQKTEYFKIVKNTEIMRLQLFFEKKPESEVRELLKNNGFRWSPRNMCWQRQLTKNAQYALERIIENLTKNLQ